MRLEIQMELQSETFNKLYFNLLNQTVSREKASKQVACITATKHKQII